MERVERQGDGPGGALESWLADLDGDGQAERVTARREDAALGGAPDGWTLSVLPASETAPALRWRVSVHGAGSFVQSRGEPGCLVLATEWVGDPFWKADRGQELVGRWFRVADGRLEPVATRPLLARRRTQQLEQQMAAAESPDAGAEPLDWLRHPQARVVRRDPYLRSEPTFSMAGRVSGVQFEGGLQIRMQMASGFFARLTEHAEPPADEQNAFSRLGDAASGLLYPPGYRPQAPERWLLGQRVTLSTYPRRRAAPRRVLWVGR